MNSAGKLWYRIATCYAFSQSLKTFVIRSFFFKKWLLTHVFGGSQGQKASCKQACVGFSTFWSWYHIFFGCNFPGQCRARTAWGFGIIQWKCWKTHSVLHYFGGAVMKYDFNKVQDRIGSDSIKWENSWNLVQRQDFFLSGSLILTLQHCRKR